jgi:hypothetical protein
MAAAGRRFTLALVFALAAAGAWSFAPGLAAGNGGKPGKGAPHDPHGFHLTSPSLSVNESAGQAVITVERTDTSEAAQIRYITPAPPTRCRRSGPLATCGAQEWRRSRASS